MSLERNSESLELVRKPNDCTRSIFNTLSALDITPRGIEFIGFGEKNITNQVKNFLAQDQNDIIFQTQKYQLGKFLGDFKNVKLQIIGDKIFANGQQVKSRVLQALFSRLVLLPQTTCEAFPKYI